LCYGNQAVTIGGVPQQGAPLADPFHALGNSQRRAIVRLLARGPRSVQQIADVLPISRPAVSRHLKLLTRAGLVSDEAHGAQHHYRLQDEGIAAVRSYLEDVWGEAAVRFRLFAENTAASTRGE
jgi:DNA-binding transcriptional ArsR family regulator